MLMQLLQMPSTTSTFLLTLKVKLFLQVWDSAHRRQMLHSSAITDLKSAGLEYRDLPTHLLGRVGSLIQCSLNLSLKASFVHQNWIIWCKPRGRSPSVSSPNVHLAHSISDSKMSEISFGHILKYIDRRLSNSLKYGSDRSSIK